MPKSALGRFTVDPFKPVEQFDELQPASVSASELQLIAEEMQKQITALTQGLAAGEQLGQERLNLQRTDVERTTRRGLQTLDFDLEDAERALLSNLLTRGIYDSGIRLEAFEELQHRGVLALQDIVATGALNMQDLDLQAQQLANQLGLDIGQLQLEYDQQGLSLAEGMLRDYGGGSGGTIYGPQAAGTFDRIAFSQTSQAKESVLVINQYINTNWLGQWNFIDPNTGQPITALSTQYRSLDAPVNENRSANSDHYWGGGLDVYFRTNSEAQAFIQWASQDPIVNYVVPEMNQYTGRVHVSFNPVGATSLPKLSDSQPIGPTATSYTGTGSGSGTQAYGTR